jgi:DNA-binding MarR family transcriptional regulator
MGEQDLWLFELVPRVNRLQNIALKDMNPALTFRQFRLLKRVEQGHRTITAIAAVGTLSLPTISESIESLVKKRLLRREDNPEDRRTSQLVLTELGLRAVNEAQGLLDDVSEWLLGGMSAMGYQELRTVGRTLDTRVVELLQKLRGTDRQLAELIGASSDSIRLPI